MKTNYWHFVHIHERANTWEETVKGRRVGGWEAWMQIRSEDVTLLKLTTIHHTRVHRFLHITSTSSSHFALKTWWVIQMCRARQSVWSQTSNCLKLTYPWYLNFLVVILTLMVKFKMKLVSVCEAEVWSHNSSWSYFKVLKQFFFISYHFFVFCFKRCIFVVLGE